MFSPSFVRTPEKEERNRLCIFSRHFVVSSCLFSVSFVCRVLIGFNEGRNDASFNRAFFLLPPHGEFLLFTTSKPTIRCCCVIAAIMTLLRRRPCYSIAAQMNEGKTKVCVSYWSRRIFKLRHHCTVCVGKKSRGESERAR